jgi:curved DNA-binding protein CbpA
LVLETEGDYNMSGTAVKNLYSVLNIAKSASNADIKKAFRQLAMELHPDRTGGCPIKARRFLDISQAYATLSDPVQRAVYDNDQRLASMYNHATRPPPTYAGSSASQKHQHRPPPTGGHRYSERVAREPRAVPREHFNVDLWNYHHYGDEIPEGDALDTKEAKMPGGTDAKSTTSRGAGRGSAEPSYSTLDATTMNMSQADIDKLIDSMNEVVSKRKKPTKNW